jgi:hypothetical protein
MWTATLKTKEAVAEGIRVTVEFSNGTKTLTETVIPQDETGFRHWVKSRLTSLNSIEEIDTKYAVEQPVDVTETVVQPTAEELARIEWFGDYRKLEQVQKLIDLAVLTGNETPVVNLRNKVKNNFLPAYIDAL